MQGFLKLLRLGCAASCVAATFAATAGTSRVPQPVDHADPYRCDTTACVVPVSGSYPHLVIGRFASYASSEQAESLFVSARAVGRWSMLPGDGKAFFAQIQPVAIRLEDGRTLTALMSQEEAHAAPFSPGDLVRYSPHRGKYEIPPDDPAARAYWAVDGCVAVICRSEDKDCFKRYASGVFTAHEGMAISPDTFRQVRGKASIDTETLLPKPASAN